MAEKILIVDDDVDTLRLAGLMLQRQGYEIVAASNGHQALVMARSEQPDLVLLDVMMPDMDGIEVAKRMRLDSALKDIPIIMFTAKSQIDDKIQGFEAGADAYLTKPTQPRELIAQVKAVLARSTKARLPAVGSAPLPERGHLIGVLSVRGGLGVSTTVLNLAVALARQTRKEVVAADFRPGFGALALQLGKAQADGLTHLFQMKAAEIEPQKIETELVSDPSGIRLLLASPRPRDGRFAAEVAHFEALARCLPFMAFTVVVDLGPGLIPVNEKVLEQCDLIIVVSDPFSGTLVQTKAMIEDLRAKGIGEGRIFPIIVNRLRSEMQLTWTQAQESLGRNIPITFTPAPELAQQAAAQNQILSLMQPDSLTAQQFIKMADKVVQKLGVPAK